MINLLPSRRTRRTLTFGVVQVVLVIVLLVLWQNAASAGRIDTFMFSSPDVIWATLRELISSGELTRHVGATLQILAMGQIAGTLVGAVLGILIAFSGYFRAIVEPYLIFLNATPRLILYPLFVIWLGFSSAPKVLTVALVVVTGVTINVAAGLREVQGAYVDNVRVLGGNRYRLIRDVYVPSLSLWLLSTTRVTMTYAFQATIAVQFVGAEEGLGYLINFGRQRFQVDLVYAAIAVVIVTALTLHALLGLVERRATRWMGTQ